MDGKTAHTHLTELAQQNPRALVNELARRSFLCFCELMFAVVEPGKAMVVADYLRLLAYTLERVSAGEVKQQIINLPPRMLKSHVATICFAAWMLGHDPSRRIMVASHTMSMSTRLVAGIRRVLKSAAFAEVFPNLSLAGKDCETEVETEAGGGVLAVSFEAAPTGRGCDCLIIDDPMQAMDIYSTTKRDGCETFCTDALLGRRNRPGVPTILVMQRLGADDLAARLMAKGGWEVLSLPLVATQDECIPYAELTGSRTFRRRAGDGLSPMWMTSEEVETLRSTKTESVWAAQYQQNPLPPGARMINDALLKYHSSIPAGGFHVQSWDTASSLSEGASYTVCLTWRVQKNCVYLVDVFRARLTKEEIGPTVDRLARRFEPKYLLVEDASTGPVVALTAKGLGIGIDVRSIKVTDPKEWRLEKCVGMFTEAMVSLPEAATWLDEFRDELRAFPGGRHDDQVDAMTLFLNWVLPRLTGDEKERHFDFTKKILACGPLDGTPPGSARSGRSLCKWGADPNLRPGSGGKGLKPPPWRR